MSNVVVLLGPIVFQDFEIPSAISFGGRQRMAVHRLPGGARVIDTLGRDESQISFSGIFSGLGATLRARAVDELRTTGLPLQLTWDVFFYTVLIADFQADYRNSWWIPFRIVCTVLRDEASTLIQTVASLATATSADIVAAMAQASNAQVDFSQLQNTLAAPGATVRGTGAYSAALSSLIAAHASVGDAMTNADITLSGVNPRDPGSAESGAANLLVAAATAGQLSSLAIAGAYIRRIAINLSNAST
jgi:hypothetical protein